MTLAIDLMLILYPRFTQDLTKITQEYPRFTQDLPKNYARFTQDLRAPYYFVSSSFGAPETVAHILEVCVLNVGGFCSLLVI